MALQITKIDYQLDFTDAVKQANPNVGVVRLAFQQLTNVSNTTPQDRANKFLKWDANGNVVESVTSSGSGGGLNSGITFPSGPNNNDLFLLTQKVGQNRKGIYQYQSNTWEDILVTGVSSFLDLSDTPSALGTAGQILAVNSGANALEFIDAPASVTPFAPTQANLFSAVKAIFGLASQDSLNSTGIRVAADNANNEIQIVATSSGGTAFSPSKTNLYDAVKEILQAGTNITITEDDTDSELTIASSGGGGGGITSQNLSFVSVANSGARLGLTASQVKDGGLVHQSDRGEFFDVSVSGSNITYNPLLFAISKVVGSNAQTFLEGWLAIVGSKVYYAKRTVSNVSSSTDFTDTDEWIDLTAVGSGGGGASTFLGLSDTPSAFTGQAGKILQVNSGATGLEFTDKPADGAPGPRGAQGFQGRFLIRVYQSVTHGGSAPSTPIATAYNLNLNQFSGLSSGWSINFPTNTNPAQVDIYVSFTTYDHANNSLTAFSTPFKIDGELAGVAYTVASLTEKTSLDEDDAFGISDSEASGSPNKKVELSTLVSYLQTNLDFVFKEVTGSAQSFKAREGAVHGDKVYLAKQDLTGVTTGTDFTDTDNWIDLTGGGSGGTAKGHFIGSTYLSGSSAVTLSVAQSRNKLVYVNISGDSDKQITLPQTSDFNDGDSITIYRESDDDDIGNVVINRAGSDSIIDQGGSILTSYTLGNSGSNLTSGVTLTSFNNNGTQDWLVSIYHQDQIQSDWNITDNNSPAFIKNKPTIPSGGGSSFVLPRVLQEIAAHGRFTESDEGGINAQHINISNAFSAEGFTGESTETTPGVDTFTMVAGNAGFGDIGYVAPVQGSNQVGSISPSISGLNQMTNNSSDGTLYLTFDSTSFPTDLASVFIDGTEYALGTSFAFSGNLYEQETSVSIPNLVNGSSYQIRFKKADGTFYSAGGSSQTIPASLSNVLSGSNITASITKEGSREPAARTKLGTELAFTGDVSLSNSDTETIDNERIVFRHTFEIQAFSNTNFTLFGVPLASNLNSEHAVLSLQKVSGSDDIKLKFHKGGSFVDVSGFVMGSTTDNPFFRIGDVVDLAVEFHKQPPGSADSAAVYQLVIVAKVTRGTDTHMFVFEFNDPQETRNIDDFRYDKVFFHGGDASGNVLLPMLPPELFYYNEDTAPGDLLRHSQLIEKLENPRPTLLGFHRVKKVQKISLDTNFQANNIEALNEIKALKDEIRRKHLHAGAIDEDVDNSSLEDAQATLTLNSSEFQESGEGTKVKIGNFHFKASSVKAWNDFKFEYITAAGASKGRWRFEEGLYLVCLSMHAENNSSGGSGSRNNRLIASVRLIDDAGGAVNLRHSDNLYGRLSTADALLPGLSQADQDKWVELQQGKSVVGTFTSDGLKYFAPQFHLETQASGGNVKMDAHMHVVRLGPVGNQTTNGYTQSLLPPISGG